MMRVLLGGVVGGVILFMWGFVSHMLTPLGRVGIKTIPDEPAVLASLKTAIPEPGLYLFPGMDLSGPMSDSEQKAMAAKYRTGPSGFLVFTPGGRDIMTPVQLLGELGSNVLTALLAACLLTFVSGKYLARVGFVTLLGLVGWLSINVSYWNWYNFPTDYTLASLVDELIGFLLLGFILPAIVKPAKAAVPETSTPAPTVG
jgi:hypothetical protein